MSACVECLCQESWGAMPFVKDCFACFTGVPAARGRVLTAARDHSVYFVNTAYLPTPLSDP